MYEVFETLLNERGLSVSDVCRATGILPSVFSNWKKRNSRLSAKNAEILANYFGVSVDYLMTGSEYYLNRETAETAQELFDQSGMRILFDAAKGSDPDALRLAAEMLRKMKETNRDE